MSFLINSEIIFDTNDSKELLASGNQSKFIFEIKNIGNKKLKMIEDSFQKYDLKGKSKFITAMIPDIKFKRVTPNLFQNNLTLIDSKLPQLLAEIVLLSLNSSTFRVRDILNEIIKENPMSFTQNERHRFYEYKILQFLSAIVFGLSLNETWTGKAISNSKTVRILTDKNKLVFNFHERRNLNNYLLDNTRIFHRNGGINLKANNGSLFLMIELQIGFIN